MKKIKIALLCPILDDPTSFYRGLGPFSALAKDPNNNIELVFPQAQSWASLKDCDILVLQRPATPEHLNMLSLAKQMGVKVWTDFDDDNLAVPKDNPMYATYNQMSIKEAVLNLARHADVLTVTTSFMKQKYGIYNKIHVIPNAIDDCLLKTRRVHEGPRENKFLWRGTHSQQRNLATVGQSLINVSKRHPEYRFVFFGLDLYDLTEQIPNHEIIGQMPLMNFFDVLCQIHAKLLYYPLHYNDHSQARSHISWLEGTYANCAVLAYRNEEFNRPGCLTYNSQVEFEDTLERVARDEVDINAHVTASWECIMDKYLLSKVNQKRLEIIHSLL